MATEINVEEYDARAMLLGMTYKRSGHYFWKYVEGDRDWVRFDADTMEPLTANQAVERNTRWRQK